MQELFVSPDDGYTRDYNPLKNYLDIGSYYIHKMTGDSIDDTTKWLSRQMANKNPKVLKSIP